MHRSIDKVHRNSEELAIRVFRHTKEIFRAGKRMNQANLIVARIERARHDRGISVAELARRISSSQANRGRLWSRPCCLTKLQARDLAETRRRMVEDYGPASHAGPFRF